MSLPLEEATPAIDSHEGACGSMIAKTLLQGFVEANEDDKVQLFSSLLLVYQQQAQRLAKHQEDSEGSFLSLYHSICRRAQPALAALCGQGLPAQHVAAGATSSLPGELQPRGPQVESRDAELLRQLSPPAALLQLEAAAGAAPSHTHADWGHTLSLSIDLNLPPSDATAGRGRVPRVSGVPGGALAHDCQRRGDTWQSQPPLLIAAAQTQQGPAACGTTSPVGDDAAPVGGSGAGAPSGGPGWAPPAVSCCQPKRSYGDESVEQAACCLASASVTRAPVDAAGVEPPLPPGAPVADELMEEGCDLEERPRGEEGSRAAEPRRGAAPPASPDLAAMAAEDRGDAQGTTGEAARGLGPMSPSRSISGGEAIEQGASRANKRTRACWLPVSRPEVVAADSAVEPLQGPSCVAAGRELMESSPCAAAEAAGGGGGGGRLPPETPPLTDRPRFAGETSRPGKRSCPSCAQGSGPASKRQVLAAGTGAPPSSDLCSSGLTRLASPHSESAWTAGADVDCKPGPLCRPAEEQATPAGPPAPVGAGHLAEADPQTLIPGLPDDAARLVLVRLPAGERGSMKCVSRGWRALVLDPSYHRQREDLGFLDRWIVLVGSNYARNIASECHVYDLSTSTWQQIPLPPEICNFKGVGAATLGGKIFICGGVKIQKKSFLPQNSAWCYDPRTVRWTQLPDMHHIRFKPAATVVGGRLFVTGGRGTDHKWQLNGEVFDPERNAWAAVAALEGACGRQVWALDGQLLFKRAVENQVKVFDPRSGVVGDYLGARARAIVIGSCKKLVLYGDRLYRLTSRKLQCYAEGRAAFEDTGLTPDQIQNESAIEHNMFELAVLHGEFLMVGKNWELVHVTFPQHGGGGGGGASGRRARWSVLSCGPKLRDQMTDSYVMALHT